jgi:D,D-heptose 1,7-bisphosphate phosphatase
MKNSVAILAGGFGTRLQSITMGAPKGMAKLCGIPVIEHQINLCRNNGFSKITLLVHHEFEQIKNYFEDGSRFNVKISYSIEEEPLGTGGALVSALDSLAETFYVLYGDTYMDINLKKMYEFHIHKNSELTIFVHPNSHPGDSDLIEVNDAERVLGISKYPRSKNKRYGNLVNAGLYICNKDVFSSLPEMPKKFDIAQDLFPVLLNSKKKIFGYKSVEYIKDMGTPERIAKVERDIGRQIPKRLASYSKRIAIFFDRDGTLIKDIKYLKSPSELKIYDDAPLAIKNINNEGYLSILATNQPVIARGELSIKGLKQIHNELETRLGEFGAYLDRIYFCPHHPDRGFHGEIADLKIYCDCRKPNIGMFLKASAELSIDLKSSWMVGDSTADIQAGINAGMQTILVRTGNSGKDGKYQCKEYFYTFDNLLDASHWIVRGHPAATRKIYELFPKISCARFIAIGGLARSGKTTFSKALQEFIRKKGGRAHVISLDGWLRSAAERAESLGVINRYRMDDFNDFMNIILNNNDEIELKIPFYTGIKENEFFNKEFKISKNDTIIIEGVTSLLDSRIFNRVNYKIYIKLNENIRQERLLKYYKLRQFEETEVKKKLNSRRDDEEIYIVESLVNADDVIDLYDFE